MVEPPSGIETKLLILIAALFALGALIILVASLIGRSPSKASDLWRLYGQEFLIVGALLIPAYIGGWIYFAFLVLLCLRTQFEFLEAHGRRTFGVAGLLGYAAGIFILTLAELSGSSGLYPMAIAGVMFVALAGLIFPSPVGALHSLLPAFGVIFPALLIAHFAMLGRLEEGFAWLASAYIVVEANDAFASLFGKLFGRRPIFPRLSPKKTLEGLLLGLSVAFLVGLALFWFVFDRLDAWTIGAIAVILIAGLAGDLLTSAIKRAAGVKDFPSVLAAHGGVLDIYDSVIAAAPALLFYFWLTGQ